MEGEARQAAASIPIMPRPPSDRIFLTVSNVALAVVLVMTLALGCLSAGFAPASRAAFLFYGCLAVYAALGYPINGWFLDQGSRWLQAVYFLLQLGLFAFMVAWGLPRDAIWLLTMPVVSQAAMFLPWPAVAGVTAAYLGLFCVLPCAYAWPWDGRLRSALSLLSAYVFVVGMTYVAEFARKAKANAERLAGELEKANAQLRLATAQAEDLAAANERNRLARDIHDGLGHYLTVIAVQLQAARALLPGQAARALEVISTAEQTSRTALDDVRRSIGALRAAPERPPLCTAIGNLVQESGLPVQFRIEGLARPLPEMLEQALFRSTQEGLTNVRKHAPGAGTEVVVDFRQAGRICLEIVDRGAGTPPEASGGFGLTGLRERLTEVGGTLATGPRPGGGFVLHVEVPA
jgi:signal transduction histidine kinase